MGTKTVQMPSSMPGLRRVRRLFSYFAVVITDDGQVLHVLLYIFMETLRP